MENPISNECFLVTIEGHRAWVDSRGLIIDADPKLRKHYLYRNIRECHKHNGHLYVYKSEGKVPYPVFLDEDKYKEMEKKNPAIKYLKDKFDCEMF